MLRAWSSKHLFLCRWVEALLEQFDTPGLVPPLVLIGHAASLTPY
jgi:hypothetical protein